MGMLTAVTMAVGMVRRSPEVAPVPPTRGEVGTIGLTLADTVDGRLGPVRYTSSDVLMSGRREPRRHTSSGVLGLAFAGGTGLVSTGNGRRPLRGDLTSSLNLGLRLRELHSTVSLLPGLEQPVQLEAFVEELLDHVEASSGPFSSA